MQSQITCSFISLYKFIRINRPAAVLMKLFRKHGHLPDNLPYADQHMKFRRFAVKFFYLSCFILNLPYNLDIIEYPDAVETSVQVPKFNI